MRFLGGQNRDRTRSGAGDGTQAGWKKAKGRSPKVTLRLSECPVPRIDHGREQRRERPYP